VPSAPVGTRLRVAELPHPVDPLGIAAREGDLACVVTVPGWTLVLTDPVAHVTDLAELSATAGALGWGDPPDRLPFTGLAAGYLSDDLAPALLDLAEIPRPAAVDLPPLWFGVYDTAACIPSSRDRTLLIAADVPGSRKPAGRRLDRLRRRLTGMDAAPPTPAHHPTLTCSLDKRAHRDAVVRIKDWIAAGDLYQLNLTLQIGADWPYGGVALARRLWAASPGAPHAAYLQVPTTTQGTAEVVSVSPETFLRSTGREVHIRPIKGTRPRRALPGADLAEADALQSSTKDHAEHVMIVDLERNDLGRVCRTGTVRVPELAALEGHPTVWHLTSTVTGTLRDDVDVAGLLAATFPCGSVTGAPKRMAVARTASVEPVRRGVYCGAIGTVGRTLDLSVAIRTAVVDDGRASYGAGGGIVADSDPAGEWAEAMHKAAAFFAAVGAEPPV
jgi:para-aminobenzoate synthetase component I